MSKVPNRSRTKTRRDVVFFLSLVLAISILGEPMPEIVRAIVIAVAPIILLIWLKLAGTYSPVRDAFGIAFVSVAFVLVQAWRRDVLRAPSAWSQILCAVSLPQAYVWLLSCWIALSLLDRVLEPASLPLTGHVATPATVAPQATGLRIGLALSGGGYRAALIHAGVLMELNQRGIPITNISSVSGGSIIGAYVGRGGDPAEFVKAVVQGRFRFKRELLSAYNLPRWILPFGNFSRRDVQASIVQRVLLAATPQSNATLPELMIDMTDLSRGISIGATDKGFLLAGPVTSRFFKTGEAIKIDGLDKLATRVSVSGAFPGAFPALRTRARFTVNPEPLAKASDVRQITLTLVDGGVRDNLGLKLLEDANANARGTTSTSLSWSGFQPGNKWKIDLIIISDGGKSLEADDSAKDLLAQVMRAIDVTGMETGIMRLMSQDPPKVVLSLPSSFSLGPDAVIVGFPHPNNARERFFFFQPQKFDDVTLDRLAELAPDRARAKAVLDAYRKTKSEINLNKVDEDCISAKEVSQTSPECRWWDLVRLVGSDIENAIAVFRKSETLEDNYCATDADALVRLGRYLVLLNAGNLDDKLAKAATAKAATPRN